MTSTFQLFSLYTPCSNNLRVKIADRSLSIVVGKGSIQICENITQTSVLFVPNLSCSLLFISKLTKDFNCIAKFSSSCEFSSYTRERRLVMLKYMKGCIYLGMRTLRIDMLLFLDLNLLLFLRIK